MNFRHSDSRSLNARLEARPRAFKVIAAILGIFLLRATTGPRGVPGESVVEKKDVTSVPVTVYQLDRS